ncbi:hybrid sensor histidine kinase/response regulator [Ketobacter sp.]|nr:MAG: hybrid sensor histidine kinase/response regulator [Ketobacter sp.]
MSKTVVAFSLGILLELLLLMPISAAAAPTYSPLEADEVGDLVLGRHLYMLEDSSGTLTLDDVRSRDTQQQFEPVFSDSPYLSRTHSTFWFRFQTRFDENALPLILEIGYPHLSHITLYQMNGDQLVSKIRSGYTQKDTRINCTRFCFPVKPAEGINTLYIEVNSDSPVFVPINLRTAPEQLVHERLIMGITTLFYGAFIVMALFNLFLYWSTREKSYVYYVFYIVTLFLWTLSHDGLLRDLLFYRNDWLSSYKTHFIITLLSVSGGAIFSQEFLKTKVLMPMLHKAFGFLVLVSLADIALIIVSGKVMLPNSANMLTFFLSLLGISAGFVGIQRGIKTARFYLIAWISVIIGAMCWILTISGIFPLNLLTAFSVQIGALLETILLALALGDRINVLQAERIQFERDANKALEESNRRLAASNRFKDEFLSTVSHELRTPMNGIFGASELLEHTQLDTVQNKYLTTIVRSSRDMMGMIENILTYTQLESGIAAADNHPFPIRNFLEDTASHYRSRAVIQNLGFEFALDETVPTIVNADEDKLKLLLDHLLDNACKFTDQGEIKLGITLSETEPASDQVKLIFTIKDTGCGVPDSLQSEIFDSFKQADGSLTRRKGGLGIGLALSQKIISILDGSMEFHSVVGKGTEVTLSLPMQRSEAAADNQLGFIADDIDPEDIEILVVEDNYVNKLVMEGQLRVLGFQVDSANNGKEAVTMMERRVYDLVFMDCQMPIMDGFEATKLIRKLGNQNADIPIVAVTANTNMGDRESCLAVGMNDYIKKPFNQSALINAINRWLSKGDNSPPQI